MGKEMSEDKRYLGDSVYLDFDGYHIVLTTENGYGADNTIILEPFMVDKIDDYVTFLKNKYKKAQT